METLLSLLLLFNTSLPIPKKLDTCLKDITKNKIIYQVNKIRIENKKGIVCPSQDLQKEAQKRADYIYLTGDFSHNKFYEQFQDKVNMGEDLARGYSENSVVEAWMRSPLHKEIILDDFKEIAVATSGAYTVLWMRKN